MTRLDEIRQRHAAVIPGPYRWFGNTATDQIYLATQTRGRLIILMPHVEVEEGYAEMDEPWRFLSGDEYARLDTDERQRFTYDRRFTLHLQFAGKDQPDRSSKWTRDEHGAERLYSHRKIARYEVLDGKTRQEAGLPPDADMTNSPLYREDIVGIDSPEAEFLAYAWEDVLYLLAELEGTPFRMRVIKARSLAFVWWRDFRYGGVQFANRKLCGWRVGRG